MPQHPLARLSPVPKQLVVLTISRESVMAGDIASVLDTLGAFSASREAALHWEGTLTLMFEGWEDDRRELSAIPEVRAYFRALTDAWPYWWHYIEKVGETFAMVLCLLCRGEAVPSQSGLVGWRFTDLNEVDHQIIELFMGMNQLYDRLELPERLNEQVSEQIAELLSCTLQMV